MEPFLIALFFLLDTICLGAVTFAIFSLVFGNSEENKKMNNIHKWRALCRAEFSQHGGSLYTAPPFWVRAIVKGDVIHVQSWGKYAGPVRRPRPQQLNRVFEEFKKGNILLPTDTPTRELHRLQLARCVEHPDGRQCWTFPRGGLHPIYAVFAHIVGD